MSDRGSEILQHEDEPEQGTTLLDRAKALNTTHKTWIRKFVAEFICLTFFTFVGCVLRITLLIGTLPIIDWIAKCVLAGTTANAFNNLEEATAQGLTIALLVISFGHISGGHINPAVTLGVLLAGGISVLGAVIYWIAQFLGCILGGFLIWTVMKNELYMQINGGATPLYTAHGTLFEGYLMETFITTILVYTVLMCALHQENQALTGLAVGFAVFVGVITGGPVTDGSMNPARSLGPLVTYSGAYRDKNYTMCGDRSTKCMPPHHVWKAYWIDFVGPITGAIIAAIIYRIFYSDVPSLKSQFKPRRSSSSRNSGTGYGTL